MANVILDWRDGSHWDRRSKQPCRLCGMPTNMRDDIGRPCHKACAEAELSRFAR